MVIILDVLQGNSLSASLSPVLLPSWSGVEVGLDCFQSHNGTERSIGEIWKARWESAYEPSCLRLPRGLELLICHLLLRGAQKGVSVTIPKLLGQWLSVAGSDTERRQPGAGVRNKAA